MATGHLAAALATVDWTKNVTDFLAESSIVDRIEACNMRLAIWAKELEKCDKGNPALSFVREMQTAGHHVAATLGLALYKPGAASMRTVLESALYFTFFRTHASELSTLVRSKKYYETKSSVLEYHKVHTARFPETQAALGLLSSLESWYGEISATVHGQIPGVWNVATSLKGITISKETLKLATTKFEECTSLVHSLFLCTVAPDIWGDVETDTKKALLKGMSGATRAILKLDAA